MESTSCAPAPRVNCLAFSHLVKKDSTVNGDSPPGTLRDDWSMVFMVLAGCIMVWAAARETAPQIMASQKCRRREGGGDGMMVREDIAAEEMAAAAAAPPR